MDKQETIDIYQCLDTYLDVINDYQSCLKLEDLVCEAIHNYSPEAKETHLGLDIVIPFIQRGNNYLRIQDYSAAKDAYLQVIELLESLNNIDEQQKQSKLAATYHQLGIVAQELREWEEARNYYQQALSIKIEYSDRYSQARTYHNLGYVAQELREWEEARNYYQQALSIYIEYSDRYSQAGTYYQLGQVAEAIGNPEDAKNYYLQALQIWVEFNDEYWVENSKINLQRFYQENPDQ